MDATLEELCVQQETEDQNYEMYSVQFFFFCFFLLMQEKVRQLRGNMLKAKLGKCLLAILNRLNGPVTNHQGFFFWWAEPALSIHNDDNNYYYYLLWFMIVNNFSIIYDHKIS